MQSTWLTIAPAGISCFASLMASCRLMIDSATVTPALAGLGARAASTPKPLANRPKRRNRWGAMESLV